MVSSSTYRSFDKRRRDNQGGAHVKITHRCSPAMDHDQKLRYQHVPSSTTLCVHPQEALGFVAAPQIANRGTITEHTTHKKSHMAQIGLHRSKHYAKEGQQQRQLQGQESTSRGSEDQTQRKRTQLNCQRQLSRGLLAEFPYTSCVHPSDYQIKINMRFGLVEQQHEIKTDKYSET